MTAPVVHSGICKHCQCTEERACQVAQPEGGYIPCSWWNEEKTVCTSHSCILKELGVIDGDHACYIVVSAEIRQFGLPGFTKHLYSRMESRFALDYLTALDVINETFRTAAVSRSKAEKERKTKSQKERKPVESVSDAEKRARRARA